MVKSVDSGSFFMDGGMSIRFILGRSGTGKTSCCIKAVVSALLDGRDDRPLVLLVPEQASYQAEQAILNDERIEGYNQLHVLSFDRLGFMLLGKNTAKRDLSRIGRQMIVQRLLRVHKDRLDVFAAAATHTGTALAIAETISELHQQGRGIDDIDELTATLEKYDPGSMTARKFADIGLIFKEYLAFIEGRFADADAQLNLARKVVRESDIIKKARLWVDGFSGFTASELAMLTELMRLTDETHIALCLDPENIDLKNADISRVDSTSLFGPTEQTYCRLLESARKCKLKIDKPVLLTEQGRFADCQALSHIENEFSKFDPKQLTSANGSVRIIAAGDTRSESKFVAAEILRLIRKKTCRYRDIAVIASDIDSYEHYLRAYLDDYSIPYFIDKRKKLSEHAVIELILSVLGIVSDGFSQSEVFAYLKTNLVPVDNYKIDYLENYCIAFGIRPDDWTADAKWQFALDDDKRFSNDRADAIRMKVVGPVSKLRERLFVDSDNKKAISPEEFTKAVFGFLDELGVRERLNECVDTALAKGDNAEANRHQQFCERLADTFDELTEAFGGIEMSCNEWTQVLKNAFSQMTLAFIPPRLDQVLVGSIERSRHPNLKAVFLLGCTQKQFPSPIGYDSVLSESDRSAAGKVEFELGPSAKDDLHQREYLAYIAFTRGSEYLCASYPAADDKGSINVCSQYLEKLAGLFEDVTIEQIDGDGFGVDNMATKGQLVELLCEKLGADPVGTIENTAALRSLVTELAEDDQFGEVAGVVDHALGYENSAVLDRDISCMIYGGSIRCSATKLGTFAACPYKYYARYVLGLEERKEFTFEPLDKGLFYHKVLDAFVKELLRQNIDLAKVDTEQLLSILRGRIEKLFARDSFVGHFNSHSRHNAYILSQACMNLEDMVTAMQRMCKAGRFRPFASEVGFGNAKNILGEYKLHIDGREVILKGKIDRLDIAEVDGVKLAIVFDYKLSTRPFSWSKFYHGLDMQLPIYLLAVENSEKEKFKAAGAFYLPIESGAKRTEFGGFEKLKSSFNYKGRGLLDGREVGNIDTNLEKGWSNYYNFGVTKDDAQYGYYNTSGALRPDDFERVMKSAAANISEIVKTMVAGGIKVAPYRLNKDVPCSWCPYKPVCRFDWQVNDYRSIETMSKHDVLDRAGGDHG